jgi:hypothetical protein
MLDVEELFEVVKENGGEDLKYLLVKGVNDSGIEEQNVTCNTSTS